MPSMNLPWQYLKHHAHESLFIFIQNSICMSQFYTIKPKRTATTPARMSLYTQKKLQWEYAPLMSGDPSTFHKKAICFLACVSGETQTQNSDRLNHLTKKPVFLTNEPEKLFFFFFHTSLLVFWVNLIQWLLNWSIWQKWNKEMVILRQTMFINPLTSINFVHD